MEYTSSTGKDRKLLDTVAVAALFVLKKMQ